MANKKIKGVLEEMYGKELAHEEVQDHKDRLIKFFGLLVEIDMKNNKKGGRQNVYKKADAKRL